MTILKHELRQGRGSLIIWTLSIALLMGTCILIYPEMADEMADVGDMFGNMGGFSAAFGMDKINFGSFLGFYGVECGNILGLGGGLYAALVGVGALSREEQGHTAEFLLTHPVSRTRVVGEKLCAALLQVVALNALVTAFTVGSIVIIGEEPEWGTLALLMTAYFLLQVELCAVTFGLSAFVGRGGMGIGLGLACGMYFLNIVANLTEKAEALKYITPYGFADGADIITEQTLNGGYLAVGALLAAAGIAAAFWRYGRKDIS